MLKIPKESSLYIQLKELEGKFLFLSIFHLEKV